MRIAVIVLTISFVLLGVLALIHPAGVSKFTSAMGWFNAALYFYLFNSKAVWLK